MSEETKDTRMLPVQCNCAWNPDWHADSCPVNLRDRLTDAQARLAEKNARIAQLAAHARGKNKALANALKEIELLRGANLRLDEEWQAMRHDLSVAQEQLEQLQAAPAERGVVPDAAALFDFLSRKYVQRADKRQAAMGITYMEAETHDLADELAKFLNPAPATADSDVREVSE